MEIKLYQCFSCFSFLFFFFGNASITLIDKTDGMDPKRREKYWMGTFKTYAPFGLNVEDSV